MFQFDRGDRFSGVSVYAVSAMRKLTAVGWSGEYGDNGIILKSGRLIRELPYSDSLGSLVYRDDVEIMIMLGKQRH